MRDGPLLLRLRSVDGGPVLAAASDQLATAAHDLDPTVDDRAARETAELLVRLAISLVLNPQSALDLDDGCEDPIRRHLAPLPPRCPRARGAGRSDRKRVVSGQGVSVRVVLGGWRQI